MKIAFYDRTRNRKNRRMINAMLRENLLLNGIRGCATDSFWQVKDSGELYLITEDSIEKITSPIC